MDDSLTRITRFLDGIGLSARAGTVPQGSFLPGLRIERGTLVFDEERLRWPGDLLHEAGHLAVTPSGLRAGLTDELDGDDTTSQTDEVAAIAWSWAALVHLALPAQVLFHEGGYRGRAAGLRLSFEMGVYPGAHTLQQWGMTRVGAGRTNGPVYPQMLHWLRA